MFLVKRIIFFIIVFALLIYLASAIIVVDEDAVGEGSAPVPQVQQNTTVRVSKPEVPQPTARVPTHLQHVRPIGYSLDDADDVIHIIEPPKHFQQLKRLVQQRGEGVLWAQQQQHPKHPQQQQHAFHLQQQQQQRPVHHNSAPIMFTPTAAALMMNKQQKMHSMPLMKPQYKLQQQFQQQHPQQQFQKLSQPPQLKVKNLPRQQQQQQHPKATKVEMPLQWSHLRKPALNQAAPAPIVATNVNNSVDTTNDLLTQESKVHKEENYSPQFPQNIPLEVLASLRNTDRYWHKPKTAASEGPHSSPLVKERIRSKKIHTVIIEKGYERDRHQRGKEQRIKNDKYKNKYKKTRTRRQAIETSDHSLTTTRGKRELGASRIGNQTKLQQQATANIQKGTKLLLHINELLRNATHFVPDEFDADDELGNTTTTITNSPLLGEIAPIKVKLNDGEIYNIIENSVNATNVILKQALRKRNNRNLQQNHSNNNCGQSKMKSNIRQQNQKNSIDCGQQQGQGRRLPTKSLQTITTSVDSKRRQRRIGEEDGKGNIGVTINRTNNGAKDKKTTAVQLRSQLKRTYQNLPSSNRTAAINPDLLYDDVISNIRRMLQANKELEANQKKNSTESDTPIYLESYSQPTFVPLEEMEHFGDFKNLNKYLNELQRIVEYLPTLLTSGTSATPNNSNTQSPHIQDIQPKTIKRSDNSADWFLINSEGKIYQTQLNSQLKPNTTIFHRFPDIPNAEEFIKNHAHKQESGVNFDLL